MIHGVKGLGEPEMAWREVTVGTANFYDNLAKGDATSGTPAPGGLKCWRNGRMGTTETSRDI